MSLSDHPQAGGNKYKFQHHPILVEPPNPNQNAIIRNIHIAIYPYTDVGAVVFKVMGKNPSGTVVAPPFQYKAKKP